MYDVWKGIYSTPPIRGGRRIVGAVGALQYSWELPMEGCHPW